MASNLEPVNEYIALTSTLTGGAVIEFNTIDTTLRDTPEQNPVEFWLQVSPTASETDPD